MLRENKMTRNFAAMCQHLISRMTTYQLMAASMGVSKANALIVDEMKTILPKYQDTWDKNLAKAYAPHLSDEEMNSIASLKLQSPFAQKIPQIQDKVGPEMQRLSNDLLVKTTSEIMSAAFNKMPLKK